MAFMSHRVHSDTIQFMFFYEFLPRNISGVGKMHLLRQLHTATKTPTHVSELRQ